MSRGIYGDQLAYLGQVSQLLDRRKELVGVMAVAEVLCASVVCS